MAVHGARCTGFAVFAGFGFAAPPRNLRVNTLDLVPVFCLEAVNRERLSCAVQGVWHRRVSWRRPILSLQLNDESCDARQNQDEDQEQGHGDDHWTRFPGKTVRDTVKPGRSRYRIDVERQGTDQRRVKICA